MNKHEIIHLYFNEDNYQKAIEEFRASTIKNDTSLIIENIKNNKGDSQSNIFEELIFSAWLENIDIPKPQLKEIVTKSMNSIYNYIISAEFERLYLQDDLTVNKLLNLHNLYFNDQVELLEIPKKDVGKLRLNDIHIQQVIGNKIVFYHPPTFNIEYLLNKFVISIFNETTSNSSQIFNNAAILHLMFEKIHPFLDGNGRIGRFLISIYIMKQFNITNYIPISKPILYNREEYILTLFNFDYKYNGFDLREVVKYFWTVFRVL